MWFKAINIIATFFLFQIIGYGQKDHTYEYFQDEEENWTLSQIIAMPFDTTSNINFGISKGTIWLKIPVSDMPENAQFIQAGFGNSASLEAFWVKGSTITPAKKLDIYRIEIYDLTPKTSHDFLYIKHASLKSYVNLTTHYYQDENEIITHDSLLFNMSIMAFVGLLMTFFVFTVRYIRSKDSFYLYFLLYLSCLLVFFLYDTGYIKSFTTDASSYYLSIISTFTFYVIALPLLVLSRVKNNLVNYKNFLSLVGGVILFNLTFSVILNLGGSGLSKLLLIEVVISLFIVLVIALKYGVYYKEFDEKWFFLSILLSVTLPQIKMIEYAGYNSHNNWLSNFFVVYIFSQLILWITYSVLHIRRTNKEIISSELAKVAQHKSQKLALINEQENLKDWVGRELHDHIGATLSAIKVMLKSDAQQAYDYMYEVKEDLNEIIETNTAPRFDHLSFEESLRTFIRIINRSNQIEARFQFSSMLVDKLPDRLKLFFYRSVQELITNAVKHGDATLVAISLEDDRFDRIIFRLTDNAKFKESSGKSLGLGLVTIRSRLSELDLILDRSEKDGGTQSLLVIDTSLIPEMMDKLNY